MHLYCTDKVFNDLKRTKYPVIEPSNETIYSWVVEHMKYEEHNIYIFMNTLYGLFLVFRYDSDKSLSINKPLFLRLLRQAHRDLGVDNALLNKYLPKKLDFTKSNNPNKDHIFVINDFLNKQTDFITRILLILISVIKDGFQERSIRDLEIDGRLENLKMLQLMTI